MCVWVGVNACVCVVGACIGYIYNDYILNIQYSFKCNIYIYICFKIIHEGYMFWCYHNNIKIAVRYINSTLLYIYIYMHIIYHILKIYIYYNY